GGVGTITFSQSGTLPSGMTFSGGILSGIPTQTGSFPISVTATDSNGCTGSRSGTLVIGCPTITVSPASVPAGTGGVAYTSTTFTQTGGVGTVTFSESGTLPTGITFSGGVLSGTPTQTGSFPIIITATDKNGCTGSGSYTLAIGCPTITVNPATIPAGTAGVAYSPIALTQIAGIGAISFGESGALPTGMTFSGGTLSGTPLQTGSFPITVTATDKNGCMGSRGYTLVINCPTITVNPGTMPAAIEFEPSTPTQFTQTGGVGSISFSTKSALPTGMTLSSAGMLSGTPAQGGTFSITVVASDANGCTGSRTLTMLVTTLDKCLKDDSTNNYVQFNSKTGNYLFTICGPNGFTMSGTGTITVINSLIDIADNKSDRQVTIQYNTTSLTGRGLLTRILTGGTTMRYPITDTNPHPVCVCGAP
ncbi:MAG: putative Ig domain-containing protein, partial [Blastocatellia bacterium]